MFVSVIFSFVNILLRIGFLFIVSRKMSVNLPEKVDKNSSQYDKTARLYQYLCCALEVLLFALHWKTTTMKLLILASKVC